MSNIQFDLPEDVAMQREQEARANTIINSMAFEIYSKLVRIGMKDREFESTADTSFAAVRKFIEKAGM